MEFIENITRDLSLPIAYCDSGGNIMYANDAWRDLIITRKNMHSGSQKKISSELLLRLHGVMDGHKSTRNYKIENRPFVANFIKLSQSKALILLFHQISQHELPEVNLEIKRLHERNVQLETFLEASYDGFWICDENGNVIQVNKAAQALNSLEGEDIIGRNVRELVDGGYYDRSVTLAVLKSKKTETLMVNSRNGKRLLATGTPLFDACGEIRYVLVNVRDITALEELREKLEKTEALSKQYQHEVSKLCNLHDLKKKLVHHNLAYFG